MKTQIKFFSVFLVLALSAASVSAFGLPSPPTPNTDDPAGIFLSEDLCGFLEGNSATHSNANGKGRVELDGVFHQACADDNGYFYKNGSPLLSYNYSSQAIYSRVEGLDVGQDFTMNFTWSNNPRNHVNIDLTTGEWSGFAMLEGLPEGTPENEMWVDFGWTCTTPRCDDAFYAANRVHTDLSTGETFGAAWNDRYGYISFRHLNWELPPQQVDVYVDFFANDIIDNDGVKDEPNHVNFSSAPLADGYENWRVRMQLFDRFTGEEIDLSSVNDVTMGITQSADSKIYLNQILETGEDDSVIIETDHPSIPECTDPSQACELVEEDGTESFNLFVSAGAPTSDTLGALNDAGTLIENYVDRGGCVGFYLENPWNEVCSNPVVPNKDEVFYDRSSARNKFEVESVDVHLDFDEALVSNRDLILHVNDEALTTDENYAFDFSYEPPLNKRRLSFRPITRADRFEVVVHPPGGVDVAQTTIPTADQTEMDFEWDLTYEPVSQAYRDATGSALRGTYTVYIRLGNDNALEDPTDWGSLHLLIANEESYVNNYIGATPGVQVGSGGLPFLRIPGPAFPSAAGGSIQGGAAGFHDEILHVVGEPEASDTLTKPTAELYICDYLSPSRFNGVGQSCYFLSYMPIEDLFAPAEPMAVIGAVKATQNASDFFTDTPGLSILGSADSLLVRNNIYSQVLRYTVGESAGDCVIDSNLRPTNNSDVVSLFGGRLLYCEGDVTLNGSTAFSDTTVVTVGGNIYVDGDLVGGTAGLIALKDENGAGGNMYIAPEVTDLHAHIFLDGALHSYDGDSRPTGIPTWDSDKRRIEILRNSLYLLGSLTSRNTIGEADGSAPFELGDGTTTNSGAVAGEYDLNRMRRFRLCYEVDATTGLVNTNSKVLCDLGERLSRYGNANSNYASFIIEGESPVGLPIFNSR